MNIGEDYESVLLRYYCCGYTRKWKKSGNRELSFVHDLTEIERFRKFR